MWHYYCKFELKNLLNMRKVSLLTVFVFAVSLVFGQELAAKYDVSLSSSSPEMQAQLGMLSGSTFEVASKGSMSRTVMNMGGMMTTTTIMDNDKKSGVMLMDGIMGKQATKLDGSNEKDAEDIEIEVELVNETKTILGHKCKKAVAYIGEEVEMTYWYTEDIKVSKGALGQYEQKDVPGFPLEFVLKQPQMTMTFTATEVDTKLKKAKGLFDTSIPKGYTEVSMDQVRQLGGM